MTTQKGIRRLISELTDRDLYGWQFILWGLGYFVLGLFLNYLIFYQKAIDRFILYFLAYIGVLFICGFMTKNIGKKQFQLSSWNFALILFLTSLLAKGFMITSRYKLSIMGMLELLIIFFVSEISYLISLIIICVKSQRTSLRNTIGLESNNLNKIKSLYASKLNTNTSEKLKELLNQYKIIIELFDWGFFNYVILWSCNIMEQMVDVLIDDIISNNNSLYDLFHKNGKPIRYTKKLESLGFKYSYEMNAEKLWHSLRNDIAHRNKIPNYNETKSTLMLFIFSLNEVPNLQVNI